MPETQMTSVNIKQCNGSRAFKHHKCSQRIGYDNTQLQIKSKKESFKETLKSLQHLFMF